MINGTVAIVGRPNVGKSTVFNRIIGDRLAIVYDEEGVTRDRIYATGTWLTRDFAVIDTGGIQIKDRPFQEQIRIQTQIAIEEADVIVFVGDAKLGVTDDDIFIAKMLQQTNKPVILAVNKIDDGHLQSLIYEFYKLGIGDPLAISSLHGIGFGDLLDLIIGKLPKVTEKQTENEIKFSLIGRPNVGKSSLVNAILNQERVIVSEIAGTTRDAIDTPFTYNEREYNVIDTAGLKRRGKIYEAVDKYSAIRALKAIERSEVVLLVLDAVEGIIEQDKNIVGYALEQKKAIIIVVNKWDAIEKDELTMKRFKENIKKEFKFIDYAPIVFVSALTKRGLDNLFNTIEVVFAEANKRVQTSVLNEIILDAYQMNPTPEFNGGRLKIFYGSQVSVKPPTFVLFVNDPKFLHFSYERYLENQLRRAFGFEGSPLNIICRKSS